ncbi:MAG TPA: signal recognition particle protein [Planctomycetota bacterium]|jgi:signal recognition particle subunit SRP54|nr:signal recognition particle protein [Planctomycetota bacterium]
MFESLSAGFQNLITRLSGKGRITEDNVKDALREVRLALLEADVNLSVARDFIQSVREKALGEDVISGVEPGQMIVKIIHDELVRLMGPEASPLVYAEAGPTVILMAGLQGAGKTTTCGKLARRLQKDGKKVLLVAADLQRPAAVEQLKVLGRDLGIPVHAQAGVTPPEVCAQAVQIAKNDRIDVVILDTAGRLHVDDALMTEVQEVARRTSPHEVFLVCDAMTGQDAVHSAKAFNDRLTLTGVILTKLDGDARGGAALSVKSVTGKPIKFVGLGEKLDKLDVFYPDRMAERILGMGDVVGLVERAQEVMDEEEAQAQAEKMFLGSFTLSDFLGLMEKVRSMGSIKDLLGMVPGMGAQLQGMNIDEREFDRSRAVIESMTMRERAHPEILNISRRERIARGAGTTIEQVNALLRNFKNMQKQMQAMKKSGLLSGLMDPTRGLKKEKQRELDRMKRLGVNPMDMKQVKAFKQFVGKEAARKARKEKNRSKKRR